MVEENFSENVFVEKLSRLTSSESSVTSLSAWCLGYRQNAKKMAEIWEMQIRSAPQVKLVPLLYLANDVVQNGARGGSEFEMEFLKVLPAALKVVIDSGGDKAIETALRLVGIWDYRRVFGWRIEDLKNVMQGNHHLEPISVQDRDDEFMTAKLAVGELPEKLIDSLQSSYDGNRKEAAVLKECGDAISCMEELERNAMNGSSRGDEAREIIQTAEDRLQQCCDELKKGMERRVSVIATLKEAIQEQESKLNEKKKMVNLAENQINRTKAAVVAATIVETPKTSSSLFHNALVAAYGDSLYEAYVPRE